MAKINQLPPLAPVREVVLITEEVAELIGVGGEDKTQENKTQDDKTQENKTQDDKTQDDKTQDDKTQENNEQGA